MSASDQERDERRAAEQNEKSAGERAVEARAESADKAPAESTEEAQADSTEEARAEPVEGEQKQPAEGEQKQPAEGEHEQPAEELDEAATALDEGEDRVGLAPWQARRLRIAAASVLMAAAAVVLAVRLASRSSVLVVGVYGLLLILCGIVIELSRRGRTRIGSWVLAAGLVAALVADWVLLP
jgi:hypothetical protein